MLFVTGTTLSVPSLMGSIMCIGVATANSILMVTFANDERATLPLARDAMLSAGYARLRPVLMTASAMILGMLPMALGLGEGGEQNAPLGRAVIGGLLGATVTTLFVVPIFYTYLRTKPPVDQAGAWSEEEHAQEEDHCKKAPESMSSESPSNSCAGEWKNWSGNFAEAPGASRALRRYAGSRRPLRFPRSAAGHGGAADWSIFRRLYSAAEARRDGPRGRTGARKRTAAHGSDARGRLLGTEQLTLPGTLQAVTEAPILARADGYLKSRLVDLGDRVHAGQPLAEIDAPELDHQIHQAEAAVDPGRSIAGAGAGCNLEQRKIESAIWLKSRRSGGRR